MKLQLRELDQPNTVEGDAMRRRYYQWDQLVQQNPATGFMQSLQWAEFKRRQKLDVLHLALYDNDTLFGGSLFYSCRDAKGATLYIAPEGPVLPWHDQQLSQQSIQLFLDYFRDRGALGVRFEPRLHHPGHAALAPFGRAPIDLIPCETLYVDIAHSDEQILSAMKSKGRYNTRYALRHGITVSQSSDPKDITKFYSVVHQASRRDGFFLEPLPFFTDLAETLLPSRMAHLFFSEHEGETLGALLLITYGTRATYLYGGISNSKRNLMGGYALQFEAMRYARSRGCTSYDFYGYDQFMVPDNRYSRFSRFKSQFGGTPQRFIGAHDYFFSEHLADAVIKALREIGIAS